MKKDEQQKKEKTEVSMTETIPEDNDGFEQVDEWEEDKEETIDVKELRKRIRWEEGIPSRKAYIDEPWTCIPAQMFFSFTFLRTVSIPDSVRIIDDLAFCNCASLRGIYIPDGVTHIGNQAFENCYSLQTVYIPDSVTEIGESAFENCIYNHRTTKTNQKYPSVNL